MREPQVKERKMKILKVLYHNRERLEYCFNATHDYILLTQDIAQCPSINNLLKQDLITLDRMIQEHNEIINYLTQGETPDENL